MRTIVLFCLTVVLAVALVVCILTRSEAAPTIEGPAGDGVVTETLVSLQPSAAWPESGKQEMWEKLITPYIDYGTCMGMTPVSIIVKPSHTSGYLYIVDAVYAPKEAGDDPAYHGFLYGTPNEELPYWVPDLLVKKCVDVLPNADEVRDQAIDEYRE